MKISLKIADLAKKLGKSASTIAKETGLNRNTVMALYHNKVDGIKFDTIEKICSTYAVTLNDIIEIVSNQKQKKELPVSISISNPYKQDGEVSLFASFWGLFFINTIPKEYLSSIANFPGLICYFIKDYGYIYWPREHMNIMAEEYYNKYGDKEKLDKNFYEFEIHAEEIRKLYFSYSEKNIISFTDKELIDFSNKIRDVYENFWHHGLFIDFFDAGYDIKKISEIQNNFGFTDSEVVTLTTSIQMTFGNERLLRLFEIMKKIVRRKISTKTEILKYIQASPEINEYIKNYDYVKSNYSIINHLSLDEITNEIFGFLKNDDWKKQYEKLLEYSSTIKKETNLILRKYSLKENPLYFFQKITYWREYRKQINLMGIHLMHYILFSIEQKTAIPYKYLKSLTHDEISNVLKGLISKEQLRKRYEEGILLSTMGGHTKLIGGKEGKSIHDELELSIKGSGKETIITGKSACQGYAKGIARIILKLDDFSRFNEGEILVTGMTRPEYVPLMKKAAAIVTNEGGITCHAAIISRELGKPCIIGTQRATSLIKDGDLIEVRANHGTVRILKN